jgi:hypothetical protein
MYHPIKLIQPLVFYANGCYIMFPLKIPHNPRPEVIVNLIVVILITITKVLIPRVVIIARVLGRALANNRKGVLM